MTRGIRRRRRSTTSLVVIAPPVSGVVAEVVVLVLDLCQFAFVAEFAEFLAAVAVFAWRVSRLPWGSRPSLRSFSHHRGLLEKTGRAG
jgi:hypothetical protein